MAKSKAVEFVWCICYINKDHIDGLERDLDNPIYAEVEAYIPTVKILKKKFKGRDQFEEIPLLFNYGFFKMRREDAIVPEFLLRLRRNVGCIYGWVQDLTAVWENETVFTSDNHETRFNKYECSVATATEEEISILAAVSMDYSVYSDKDIDNLTIGSTIVLHGFPFDNVPATVQSINKAKREVKVKLELFKAIKEVAVSFDNIFYTIYKSKFNEESVREVSLDKLREQGDGSTLDSIYAKAKFYEDPNEE